MSSEEREPQAPHFPHEAETMMEEEHSSLLAAALQVSRPAAWVYYPGKGRSQWSAEIYRLLDVASDAMPCFQTIVERALAEDRDALLRFREAATATKGPHSVEYRIRLADGSIRWLRALAESTHDESGVMESLRGITQDVTERKHWQDAVGESQALHASVINSLSDHIAVLDERGLIRAVNRAWCAFAEGNGAGPSAGSWIGLDYLKVCEQAQSFPYDEGARAALVGIRSVLAGKETEFELEYPCHGPDVARWFRLRVTPLDSARGGAVVAHEDITQRVRTESRLQAIMDASPVPMALNDAEQNITFLNPAFVRTFGYTQEDLRTLDDWWPRAYPDLAYRQGVIDSWNAGLASLREAKQPASAVEVDVTCKDGMVRSVIPSAASLGVAFSDTLVVLYDITERKHAEDALRESEAQRWRLGERLWRAHDDERRRIARELHDHTGSTLAAVLLHTKLIEASEASPATRAAIASLTQQLERSLQEVARMARGLHPVALDELGLEPAIEQLVRAKAVAAGIQPIIHISLGARPLSPPLELTVYRIVQEALTNVLKHARARHVNLRCIADQELIHLTIQDDGAGFDTANSALGNDHLGLVSIRERAHLVGGQAEISSIVGSGTTVQAHLPIQVRP